MLPKHVTGARLATSEALRMKRTARSPNKSLQGSVTHKVLGRGRPSLVLTHLTRHLVATDVRDTVLSPRRGAAAAELGRWASPVRVRVVAALISGATLVACG